MGIEIDALATLGGLIRQARKQQGLNQHDLAAAAGTTQKVLSTLESGTRATPLPIVIRLLAGLGLHLELAGPTDTPDDDPTPP
jgi:transcriptional regulator with XRE-family HTH domain